MRARGEDQQAVERECFHELEITLYGDRAGLTPRMRCLCFRIEPGALLHHLVKLVFRGKVLLLTFGRSSLRPTREQLQFFGCEGLIVPEIAESLHRAPRWHPALQHFFLNRSSPRKCFLILHQRKCPAPFPMARHASRIENARNLAIPSHRRRHDVVRLSQRAHPDYDNACEVDLPFHAWPPEVIF